MIGLSYEQYVVMSLAEKYSIITLSSIIASSFCANSSDDVYQKTSWKSSGHYFCGINILPRAPITSAIFFLTTDTGSAINLSIKRFLVLPQSSSLSIIQCLPMSFRRYTVASCRMTESSCVDIRMSRFSRALTVLKQCLRSAVAYLIT